MTINSSDNITYYINGKNAGGCTGSDALRSVEFFHIAGINASDPELFSGQLDEVRVYDEALTSMNVYKIYTLGAAKHGITLR